jgi:hypothetical protein
MAHRSRRSRSAMGSTRGAHQHHGARHVPIRLNSALVLASAAQPTLSAELETHGRHGNPLATPSTDPSSLARSSL